MNEFSFSKDMLKNNLQSIIIILRAWIRLKNEDELMNEDEDEHKISY